MKGMAVAFGHRVSDDEKQIPMVSTDYKYMSDKQEKEEEKGMPVLVAGDSASKMRLSCVVPHKGRDPYAIKVLAEFLTSLGHQHISLKSDGENPILALMDAVKRETEVERVKEESPATHQVQVRGLCDE